MIDLPRGKELDNVAVTKLQAARPVRMVVLVGPVASGKTTLLNTVNDLFQEGKIGTYSFSGSMTLPAFEERCHLSRTTSERAAQDTDRTKVKDARYLHLQVSGSDLNPDPVDLLFTDISGETFEDARKSISECQELTFLQTADHVLLVIDCEKTVDLKKRNKVIHQAMGMLRQCLDSGMLSNSFFVTVVWAKYDWIAASEDGEHKLFLQRTTKEFEEQFASRVGKLSFAEVAARPEKGDLKFGHGVPELLKEWAVSSPRHREMNLVPDEAGDRESEKFLKRHFNAIQDSQ
jgi:energy-coupling factor transporter ATP-binding protein EcfA2